MQQINKIKLSTISLSAIFFSFVVNIIDIISLLLNQQQWVPINSTPFSIGDSYHYFSMLKMIAYGGYYILPYNEIDGFLYSEVVRILPYLINLPIYYLGSELFDIRYGVLFVKLYNSIILFFSLYYLFTVVNKKNNWNDNLLLKIISIFILFFGFYGMQIFLSQNDFIVAFRDIYYYFQYFNNESFIYNNANLNDLTRAIIASSSAPIAIFVFAFRINKTNLSLSIHLLLIATLAFTSFPLAISFAMFSLWLEYYHGMKKNNLIKYFIFSLFLGGVIAYFQLALISYYIPATKEVLSLSGSISFSIKYFSAILLVLFIYIVYRGKLSKELIGLMLILALFQGLNFILGGEHGSRVWNRSNIIVYIFVFGYLFIYILNDILKRLSLSKKVYTIVGLGTILGICFIIGRFLYLNYDYSMFKKEKYTSLNSLNGSILNNDKKFIVVTNSLELIHFSYIYGKYLTPLASHYSLQPNGYIYNLARLNKNFELIGVDFKKILENINITAPQRHWLAKRVDIIKYDENYFKYYFDELLFLSTYCSYNNKMLIDKVKTKDNLLTKKFYELDISDEKKRISNILNNKDIIYLVDPHIKERVNF